MNLPSSKFLSLIVYEAVPSALCSKKGDRFFVLSICEMQHKAQMLYKLHKLLVEEAYKLYISCLFDFSENPNTKFS